MNDESCMRLAIAKAQEGIVSGQSPFGAVIVRDGQPISAEHNSVWRDCDPTRHAEMNAIRRAARALGCINLHGCDMFSTCEPCPMCLAAIHWAKIDRVIYGATIEDACAAGFSELRVGAEELARLGGSHVVVQNGLLIEECRILFDIWSGKAY